MLAANGKNGALVLTWWAKVVSTVAAAVLVAGTLASIGAYVDTQVLKSKVLSLEEDVSSYLAVRDQVNRLEGRVDALQAKELK